MQVKVEFEGGLQTDFNAPDGLDVEIPAGTQLQQLAAILAKKFLDPAKPVRFVDENGDVVPGILVMINETDGEIEGMDVELKTGDVITYISTLHGG